MDVMEAIKGRRSVRKYKTDPIPEEILHSLMEATRCTSSWHDTQCWEVIVVKDSQLKSELVKALPRDNLALSSMTEAPAILIFCAKDEVSGFDEAQPAVSRSGRLLFDAGLAVENLCLAAYSLGLGTVIVGLFDHQKVAELLRVPENIDVIAMVPLGFPAAEGNIMRRKNVSEFTSYDKYCKKNE